MTRTRRRTNRFTTAADFTADPDTAGGEPRSRPTTAATRGQTLAASLAPRPNPTTDNALRAIRRLQDRARAYHAARVELDRRRALMMGEAWRVVKRDQVLSLAKTSKVLRIDISTLHTALARIAKARKKLPPRRGDPRVGH